MDVEVKTRKFSVALQDILEELLLSRKAMGVSPRTVQWYTFNLTRFIQFAATCGVMSVDQVDAHLVWEYLSKLEERDLSDHYIHGQARNIRTLLKFALDEGYIDTPVKFRMPKIRKKRLPTLDIDDAKKLVKACDLPRDKAMTMLALDTGLRLSEIINLDWGHINFKRQILVVRDGKGGKDRVVAVGSSVLQHLLKYKRTLPGSNSETDPVFQTRSHGRFTTMGLRSVFVRLAEKSGVKFSAHALRRTFAKMSVKSGRDVIYIQQLMGHENIETTRNYIQDLDEEDIIQDHQQHGFADKHLK